MEDVHGEGGKLDDELGYDHVDDAMDEQQPQSLLEAIERGDARSVSRVLSELPREEQKRELTEECAAASRAGTSGSSSASRTMTSIFHAAASGNVEVFLQVHASMKAILPQETVVKMLTSTRDSEGRNLLMTALESACVKIVGALVKLIDAYEVAIGQRGAMLSAVNDRYQTALMYAVRSGRAEIVNAVAKLIGDTWVPSIEEEIAVVTAVDRRGWTPLTFAVATGRTEVVDAVVALIERIVPAQKVNPLLEDSLKIAISRVFMASAYQDGMNKALSVVSCLLKHGAWPTPKQLSLMGSEAGFEPTRKCLLDAICWAINPLAVGMTLSLQLEGAAGLGNEGLRQISARLQKEVEDLVLEVFERLPHTVDGLESEDDDALGGMEACSIIFEPEKIRRGFHHPRQFHDGNTGGSRVKMGPLEIALQSRPQLEVFCTQPLVLDFMSRRFAMGLPGLEATEEELRYADEVKNSLREPLSLQETNETRPELSKQLLSVLAGPDPTFGSLTFYPGAQFILAQVVTRPAFCYAVPAVRMGMYLIVYVLMLAIFGKHVLLYHGAVGVWEVIFFVYVLGAIVIELNELWAGRDEYMKDHWNVLDVMALALCGAAFLVRISDPDNLWGRALYGTGAPLLLFRTLFFAQFLPAQGPMIEIIFSLAGELLRFGTIMMVVMMGFAMSFFALFRHSCTVDSFRTYTDAFISLLRAMLGETRLFDDFTLAVDCCDDTVTPSDELHCEDFLMECCHNVKGEYFDGLVGKALLVGYLTLMGIILLNLLIAVLSEAYVDVKENIETESKVSRTLVIRHNMEAVESDMIPSPLNLLQSAVALPAMVFGVCTNRKGLYRKAMYYSGLALFWFFSGLSAVAAGCVLWLVSWPKAIMVLFTRRSKPGAREVHIVTKVAVMLCGVVMPLYLLYNWLWASTCGALVRYLASRASRGDCRQTDGYNEIGGSGAQRYDDGIIGKALKLAPGALSVQQLREFLANPMNDPVVQRDEETRETTVEHIKLLRDRLEGMVGDRVGELETKTVAGFESLEVRVQERVTEILNERVSALSQKVDAVDQKINEVLRRLSRNDG